METTAINDWQYVLELKGAQFSRMDAHTFGSGEFVQRHYFSQLADAFAFMLRQHLDEYHKDTAFQHHWPCYYAEASLKDIHVQQTVATFNRPQDLEALPPIPGWYLHSAPNLLTDISKAIGFDVSNLPQLNPAVSTFQLAYLKPHPYPSLFPAPPFHHYLQHRPPLTSTEKEQYIVRLDLEKKRQWDKNSPEISEHYHYSGNLEMALQHLLTLPPEMLEHSLAAHHQLSAISFACIVDYDDIAFASIIPCLPSASNSPLPGPGLYLQYLPGLDALADTLHPQVNQFPTEHEPFFQLYQYTKNFQALVPTKAWTNLSQELGWHFHPAIAPYIVETSYNVEFAPGRSGEESRQTKEANSFQDGYEHLIALPATAFDPAIAKEKQQPYIQQIALIEKGQKEPAITRFYSDAYHENLPNGVYVKVNAAQLNYEALKLTSQHFILEETASSAHFLICRPKQPTDHSIPLTRPSTNRTIQTDNENKNKKSM